MLSEDKLISGCKKHNSEAQRTLYEKYVSLFRAICLRYSKNRTDAEDILQEGFYKIFLHIREYSGKGSFEGWMKRIIVNTALSLYQEKKKEGFLTDIENINEAEVLAEETDSENQQSVKSLVQNASFSTEELFTVIHQLHDGYRVVFNLYAIEGYSHKEIAGMLDISENTSKSQLSRARKIIRDKLYELSKNRVAAKQIY